MMTLTTGIVEEGLSMPRAVFGVSPFLDLSRSTKSAQKPDEAFISPLVCDFVESLTPLVVPPVGDAKQWSPLFHAIPANFPPCYISASQNEICTDEIIGFVDKLRANDVEVQLDMQPHLIHAFTLMYPLFDEAKVAHAKMVKWLDEQVNC